MWSSGRQLAILVSNLRRAMREPNSPRPKNSLLSPKTYYWYTLLQSKVACFLSFHSELSVPRNRTFITIKSSRAYLGAAGIAQYLSISLMPSFEGRISLEYWSIIVSHCQIYFDVLLTSIPALTAAYPTCAIQALLFAVRLLITYVGFSKPFWSSNPSSL